MTAPIQFAISRAFRCIGDDASEWVGSFAIVSVIGGLLWFAAPIIERILQ